ncbi:MAG: glutamine--fructose-6-phosphate transaminase (isomerizing) [Candidatus Hydrothermarchaeales archaeon]
MCGIVGYLGKRKAAPLIFQSLRRLEYRGYDSWGIATIEGAYESSGLSKSKAGIFLKKEEGSMDDIKDKVDFKDLPGEVGIGHTRWATHGGVTKENAHPHLDCNKEIALVHNGIVNNYAELKEGLLARGHEFKSNTDTECLVHLIEEEYNDSLEEAVRSALGKVKGTYAIAVLSAREPGKLVCARDKSPLALGIGDGELFIGSDILSFLEFTRNAVLLDDGEYAVLEKENYTIRDISTGRDLKKQILEVDWPLEAAEKEGYPHFMLKEISEQPQGIVSSMSIYLEDISALAKMIYDVDRVYLVAAGTSLHAAMVAEYWFAQLCKRAVITMDSSEFLNKGIADADTLVIGITQSGETYDTLAALRYAKSHGAKTAAVVNVIGSTATRLADHFVLQGSGVEISVCATKTYTSQLIVLLRTALELAKMLASGKEKEMEELSRVEEELLKCPDYVASVLEMKDEIKGMAEKYLNVRNYIYLGKGINLPSALEGALKFKEITYYHAEGMSGGLLKHGTISLIDESTHTIAIVPAEGENRSRMINNIHEVKARDGLVIGITSGEPVKECDASIVAPKFSEVVSPIVFAPIYQLLAYYTAAKLGRNIDKPRALAKSVTVE